MSEDSYKGGSSPESFCGCLAAAVVGIPVFIVLLLGSTLGNYGESRPPSIFLNAVLPFLGVCAAAGFLVWLLVKLFRERER